MRIAHKLSLLTVAAVMAVAFSASSAFADTDIEVVHEGTEEHCTDPVVVEHEIEDDTGCHGNVEGTHIDLAGHVFGIESSAFNDCTNTFEVHFDENGEGYVTDMLVTPGVEGDDDCVNVVPCDSEGAGQTHPGTHGAADEHVWPIHAEEIGAEEFEAQTIVCFRTGLDTIPECEGELDLHIDEINAGEPSEQLHVRAAEDHNNPGSGVASLPEGSGTFSTHCEVQNAEWVVTPEDGEGVDINHL